MNNVKLITSEAVRPQHPDKVADQIANSLIAEIIRKEKEEGSFNLENPPKAGIEVFLFKGGVVVGGEVSTNVYVDVDKVVRDTVLKLGYNNSSLGLDGNSMSVMNVINKQSPDIARGVNKSLEVREGKKDFSLGAGDQGLMIGFAINETDNYMPLPISIANSLMKELDMYRDSKLGLDGKGQVTVAYDRDTNKPLYIDNIVISNSYKDGTSIEIIRGFIKDVIIPPVLSKYNISEVKDIYINPTGRWKAENSCSASDCGVTGRKLVACSYGGYPGSGIGGGAFDGKDPTKTDFSGMVGSRWVAKNIVASGLVEKCSVILGYSIGVAEPVSVYVDTFGKADDKEVEKMVRGVFDLTPLGLIKKLELYNPDIYDNLTTYGLFDNNDNFKWESCNRVEDIKLF